MFKKTEIAIAGASRSTAEFRLDALKLIRDLLNWRTLISKTPNKQKAKRLENILKKDISTLNLIVNGELRGSQQRKEKMTTRLINKYKENTNTKLQIDLTNNNNNNNDNNTNNNNNNNNTNNNTNNNPNKRRKLNHKQHQSTFQIATELNSNNNNIYNEYNSPAIGFCKRMSKKILIIKEWK